ncbi:MAG: N-acyl homoserine lactonase family protein [Pseudomonadota bacterium]
MIQDEECFDLYAIKYASLRTTRSHTFLGGVSDDGPLDMAYYVWVAVSAKKTVLIDTGFSRETALRRGRTWERCPIDSLQLLGVSAGDVDDLIVTHLHYDHAGNIQKIPNAKIHVQQKEMQFATSRYMCIKHISLGGIFEEEDVCTMVKNTFAGRVQFLEGDTVITPGIRTHLTGGHTPGMQMVSVKTKRGWVMLMSDAAHLYENIATQKPFHIAFDVADMVSGWRKAASIVETTDCLVPGHDPLVMEDYTPYSVATTGVIFRLDRAPVKSRLCTKEELLSSLPSV